MTTQTPDPRMKDMYLRRASDAFTNAKLKGMTNPNAWMYMYSKRGEDFFKNTDFRNYISFKQ
jgi:hypothetical protein